METEELCSISISPLVTIPFATQWSPDNQISIITEKGVHIFEFQPSPMSPDPTIKFTRSFIYPSDILPAYAFVNKIDSLIWKLEREEVYSLFMEEAISPKLIGTNDIILKIVKVAWSPKNLVSPSQCILAILTTAGTVELLHKISNEWYSICDITSFQLNIIQNEIKSKLCKCENSCQNNFTIITESIRQLQACSMAWTELFKAEESMFAYFSVAYRSGDISVWKIPRISNFTKSLHPLFMGTINLNIAMKINVLCWVTIKRNEHLLIAGYYDGQIYGVKLETNDESLKVTTIEKYIDSDHITVNYLHIVSHDKSNIRIFAVKGFLLLSLCIDQSGTLKNMQHLQMNGFNITGIISIDAEQLLITTQNSCTFIVDVQLNNLFNIDIKNHLPQTHVQYLGLAQSPNKVIFINIISPNTTYDHLVLREPSIIHIFTIKGTKWDPLSIINSNMHLKNVWDCMEVLRLKTSKMEIANTIYPIMDKFHSLSLYNLQVSMWTSVISDVCKTKKSILNMDHIKESKMSETLPLIFIHSACTYLDSLKKNSILSKDQTLSLNLLRRYLEMCLKSNDDFNSKDMRQRIEEVLNATASCPIEIETCNLCNEVINEFFWNVTSCPSGHKLPRCSMTLLQITSLEYRICPICGQIFHLCLEEIYEEPYCQFCDVPIICNTYTFNVEESQLYGRNLSQLQINAESSKEQDLEEPPEERRKNKWNTSHTFSVIVRNDDNDESGRITERWEEF